MIAREQRAAFDQTEAEVVRGMAGGRDRLERPTVARNPFAVGEDAVGHIIGVECRIGTRAIVRQRQRRAADDRRDGRELERRRGGAVRTEQRRGGEEWVGTWRSGGGREYYK